MKPCSVTKQIKAFTLVELMLVVMIIGILAISAGSLYVQYVARSKTQEAYVNLSKITEGQISYFAREDAFIATGPTNIPPSSNKQQVNFFSNPAWNWDKVSFSISSPIYYGYQCYDAGANYSCEAQGDLDGDGDLSIFSMNLSVNSNGQAIRSGMLYFDELE